MCIFIFISGIRGVKIIITLLCLLVNCLQWLLKVSFHTNTLYSAYAIHCDFTAVKIDNIYGYKILIFSFFFCSNLRLWLLVKRIAEPKRLF